MKNIVLIGMPGSGKTTFGRALSRELNRPFVDADDYLEEREGRTISSFFAESEKAFRDAEERTIRELADRQGIVISTGGGVMKRTANVENLRRNGLILIDRRWMTSLTMWKWKTGHSLRTGRRKCLTCTGNAGRLTGTQRILSLITGERRKRSLDRC